jgi:hypothetical protein
MTFPAALARFVPFPPGQIAHPGFNATSDGELSAVEFLQLHCLVKLGRLHLLAGLRQDRFRPALFPVAGELAALDRVRL